MIRHSRWKHFRRRSLAGLGEQLPWHRLEQIAARERGTRGLDGSLIFTGRVIGKSLPRRSGIDACRGIARQALRRFSVPGEIVAQDHAAPGGAVIGEQAIRHIQHDIALVALARALLHQIFDLEHQIVGECAEQAEQRIVIGTERRHEIAHQRHHAGASGTLVFVDRRCAAQDMAGKTACAVLGDDDAGVADHLAEEGDQDFAARIQRLKRKIRPRRLQLQRRIG